MGKSNKLKECEGQRAIRFIEKLTLVGDYAGVPFKLRPWQKTLIKTLFGTKNPDGTRKFKRAFWALARKSGKTPLVAAILLYLLLGSGKTNQEIYSCSGDRKQAGLIWRDAASMIRADPYLSKLVEQGQILLYEGHEKKIVVRKSNNIYEALSSDAPTKHGLSPSAVLFDEVHVYPNRELHDILTSAFGARKERLSIYITTAGHDRNSLCYELWEYARNVRDGITKDEKFYPVLYEADPSDDWTAEETWRKALPGLGDFTNLDFIRDECEAAKVSPGYEATFKKLYLNLWVSDLDKTWLSVDLWDKCERHIDWTAYRGRTCFGGLDASTVKDLSALVLVFPEDDGTYSVLPYFWVPGETARERERMDRVPFMGWARDGHVFMSNQPTIDQGAIQNHIKDLAEQFDIQAIGFDKAGIGIMVQQLQDAGINMLNYSQRVLDISPPAKWLETLIINGQLNHDGNPCMAWNIGNARIETNKYGAIYPRKQKPRERIDGVMSAIMALGLCMNNETQPVDTTPKIYI